MSQTTRKILAIILLFLLLVVPFVNWKLGALFWMCAWLTFIFQNLFSKRSWKLKESDNEQDEPE